MPLELALGRPAADPDSADWVDAPLRYKAGKTPFLSAISRDDGTPDSLFREELEEFEELLEDKRSSRARQRVLDHLRQSRFIVANDLPTADIDDDGYGASATFLDYFVQHCGGMVQADGEGFYDGAKLLVKLD